MDEYGDIVVTSTDYWMITIQCIRRVTKSQSLITVSANPNIVVAPMLFFITMTHNNDNNVIRCEALFTSLNREYPMFLDENERQSQEQPLCSAFDWTFIRSSLRVKFSFKPIMVWGFYTPSRKCERSKCFDKYENIYHNIKNRFITKSQLVESIHLYEVHFVAHKR
jgi:hypothetical protein